VKYSSLFVWIRLNFTHHRVVVYSPQIYENFSLKSGEGLSIAFVVIWLLGDLCNLVGASMAGLLPTVIILAGYVRLMFSLVTWPASMSCLAVYPL
jgi:solute carrier family 66 (lysosomal lysine-arginine transporter), member 1